MKATRNESLFHLLFTIYYLLFTLMAYSFLLPTTDYQLPTFLFSLFYFHHHRTMIRVYCILEDRCRDKPVTQRFAYPVIINTPSCIS
jgi:hypothetical protein